MIFHRRASAFAALVAAASCVSAAPTTIVDLSSSDLEYSPAHNANPGADAVLASIETSQDPIRNALVLEHGKVVASYVRDDVNEELPYPVFSVTKSWLSLMIGMLVDDGALALDETLGDVFYDKRCINGIVWEYVDESDFVKNVTIEEMLSMSSGLVDSTFDLIFDGSEAREVEMDWSDPYVLANLGGANLTDSLNYLDVATTEKGQFIYVGTSQILGYVVLERSGLTPRQFASERVFPLIGINESEIEWDENYDNMQHAFSGLHLTQEQMAKFGQLYLQRGLASSSPDARVISEEWVEATSSVHAAPGFPGMSYGYLFWLFNGASIGFPSVGEFYCAQGLGSQTICIHEKLDRVAVMQVDVSAEQVSQTAQLSLGLVVFNEATSFEAASDGAGDEAVVDGSKETEETAEGDDTSGSVFLQPTGILAGLISAWLCSVL